MGVNAVPCMICGEHIEDGQEIYACAVNREFMSDLKTMEYSVTDSSLMASACKPCYEKHNIGEKVEVALYEEVQFQPSVREDDSIISGSQYECLNCGEHIPNGNTIVTIVQSLEKPHNGEYAPIKTWLSYQACELCAEAIEVESKLGRAINTVIDEIQK